MDKMLLNEAFPGFKTEGRLEELMKDVVVYRITTTKDRKLITVYVKASYLVPKKDVRLIEKKLSDHYFPEGEARFRLLESFELSDAYTPRDIFEEYRDSVEAELHDYNPILESIMHRADLSYEDEGKDRIVLLTVDDTPVVRNFERELLEILHKIVNERCGVPAVFRAVYIPAKHSKAYEDSMARMQNEIKAFSERMAVHSAGEDEPFMESNGENEFLPGEDTASQKAPEKAEGAIKEEKSEKNEKGFKSKGKKSQPKKKAGGYKRSDDPGIVYGRNFDDKVVRRGKTYSISYPICEIEEEMDEVVIKGRVIYDDAIKISGDRVILVFHITDMTDTITVKLFTDGEDFDVIHKDICTGACLQLRGRPVTDKFDKELTIGNIVGIRQVSDTTAVRMDNCPRKRVELHCHTKMSDMDGVSKAEDILKRAASWGMKALAITDHGVVQAFTDACHTKGLPDDFKIIYGMEGYLVDDEKQMVENSCGQRLLDTYVVFDIETTGFSPVKDRIIEIGAVKISGGTITDRFSTFVNPERPIPFDITKLTSIDDSTVKNAPTIKEVLPKFLDFVSGAVLVAHNASFDVSFIRENAARLELAADFTVVDTVALSRFLLPELGRHKLDNVAKHLGVSLENHHRAVDDAECTALIFIKLCDKLFDMDIYDLDTLNEKGISTPDVIKKLPMYHIVLLAKNDVGRVNLYKLVSDSHLKYFANRPRIPRSLLSKYREGLILGSACEAGEVFRAVLNGAGNEELARLVSFYDYLEIQPIGNNDFLRREGRVSNEEELRDLNRTIVKLGEKFNKPVCATCDVHFLDPEDEVYRRIIMAGKGFDDADNQAPLFLHTTDEMLEEFSYLGSDKAEEVVITNTNFVADCIEKISPVRPDKCPPVIEHSDEDLREMCVKRAHEIYGDPLPAVVEDRMERELHSIISNGFAVMYIIAQKLVKKSNEDGYLVGSRGSVGSSFVAYLAGITEVNSLSPHYYCESCHYTEFDSEEVKQFSGMAGCDMPDKVCPNCGKPLKKDGFDIPFETFLGFKGDKEPDIDLNFSGEYQARAHKYTEVIFGEGHTFKAGTVGKIADTTAFGYVKKYFEERGIHKRRCEIERLSRGCVDVKRTTGQHPGGIIVLPHGEEIYYFTPVQNPANDGQSGIITTHFDYHSIDHNLLKLDILGHDDPTMIRFLEDVTGVNARQIPLDDKQVMSLFESTEALGIKPEDIGGTKLGALGIPEFGTEFAMQMLCDTKPRYFSDLVRIAGLSHGTDVYLGNADVLIKEGKATISTAICTRDDIMVYLIHMGVDPALSFKIMESVRKGKVAKGKESDWPAWKEEMASHGVPDWYIWSCEKIQYMFPKAHAAAYVMMAWRIAWFKINYPLAYYAAYFSIRAGGDFSYELMCNGRERLDFNMEDFRRRSESGKLAPKEVGQLKVMKVVQEMYARGFEFAPIDLEKVGATQFRIYDGKLMPSLSSIEGVGENAAQQIVLAASKGKFLSRDEFRDRTKAPQNVCEMIHNMGLLGDVPVSNQMSIFDLM